MPNHEENSKVLYLRFTTGKTIEVEFEPNDNVYSIKKKASAKDNTIIPVFLALALGNNILPEDGICSEIGLSAGDTLQAFLQDEEELKREEPKILRHICYLKKLKSKANIYKCRKAVLADVTEMETFASSVLQTCAKIRTQLTYHEIEPATQMVESMAKDSFGKIYETLVKDMSEYKEVDDNMPELIESACNIIDKIDLKVIRALMSKSWDSKVTFSDQQEPLKGHLRDWSNDEVCAWVKANGGLSPARWIAAEAIFTDDGVDGKRLLSLTEPNIDKLIGSYKTEGFYGKIQTLINEENLRESEWKAVRKARVDNIKEDRNKELWTMVELFEKAAWWTKEMVLRKYGVNPRDGVDGEAESKQDDATYTATALYHAARAGDETAAVVLLSVGADVAKASSWGPTPLWIAARWGHTAVARLLLKAGADVNRAVRNGTTPLWAAAIAGYAAMVRLLLRAGAGVNKADIAGWTPLYQASHWGRVEAVRELLKGGAKVDNDDIKHAKTEEIKKLLNDAKKAQGAFAPVVAPVVALFQMQHSGTTLCGKKALTFKTPTRFATPKRVTLITPRRILGSWVHINHFITPKWSDIL